MLKYSYVHKFLVKYHTAGLSLEIANELVRLSEPVIRRKGVQNSVTRVEDITIKKI